jgi:hypothetical protein
MKKIILFIVLIAFSINVFSKEDQEEQSLFGGDKVKVSGFGGPEVKFSQINKEFAVLVGGRGGVIFNSVVNVGMGGYGLVTSPKTTYKIKNLNTNDTLATLRVGYGGLILGYTNSSNDLIHFTMNILIGGGGATYTDSWLKMNHNNNNDYNFSNTYESSAFFVAEPFLGAELNVTSFFRIEANAAYRFVSMLDLPNTTNSDLSGFSGGLIFKFGKF